MGVLALEESPVRGVEIVLVVVPDEPAEDRVLSELRGPEKEKKRTVRRLKVTLHQLREGCLSVGEI